MLKKYYKNKNRNFDRLTSRFFKSLYTTKHFDLAIENGCKVLIVDKDNNLVEYDKSKLGKVLYNLEKPDVNVKDIIDYKFKIICK